MAVPVTAPARITQADIDRAVNSCKKAGYAGARISLDLAKQRIDIYVGDAVESPPPADDDGGDDDYG